MKKILFVLLSLFMLCSIVYSIEPGADVVLTTMPKCEGTFTVDVQQEGNNTDDYTLKDCSKTDINKWKCNCVNNNLTFQTMLETKNKYDFIIRYNVPIVKDNYSNISNNKTGPSQLEQAIADSARKFEINNIEVKRVEAPPTKEPFQFPELEGGLLIAIMIGCFLFVIILVIVLVWRWISKDEIVENSRPAVKKENIDNDLIRYLNEKSK